MFANFETAIVVVVVSIFCLWGAVWLKHQGKRMLAEDDLDGKVAIWGSRVIIGVVAIVMIVLTSQVFDLRMMRWRNQDLTQPVPTIQITPDQIKPSAQAEPEKELKNAKQHATSDFDEWQKKNSKHVN